VHRFPQAKLQKPLAKKKQQVYSLAQIEPGSLKNFAAQLKEGAAVARPLRPQSFGSLCFSVSLSDFPCWDAVLPDRFLAVTAKVYDLTLVRIHEQFMGVPGIRVLANR